MFSVYAVLVCAHWTLLTISEVVWSDQDLPCVDGELSRPVKLWALPPVMQLGVAGSVWGLGAAACVAVAGTWRALETD